MFDQGGRAHNDGGWAAVSKGRVTPVLAIPDMKGTMAIVVQRNKDPVRRGWTRRVAWITALLGLTAMLAVPATATHTYITSSDNAYNERGNSFNGYRVYLSAPRHSNSGNRGELGWEENINGRHWSYYAAQGNYISGNYTSSLYRSITTRGYKATVSANSRDNGYLTNRTSSNNWGADLHIVTHTNAGGGSYFLVMVDDATNTSSDRSLRTQMDIRVGDAVPGSDVQSTDNTGYTNWTNLAELRAAAPYNVYVEIIFHDTQSHVDWFGSGTNWAQSVTYHAWRYGYAIDKTLGYPR